MGDHYELEQITSCQIASYQGFYFNNEFILLQSVMERNWLFITDLKIVASSRIINMINIHCSVLCQLTETPHVRQKTSFS